METFCVSDRAREVWKENLIYSDCCNTKLKNGKKRWVHIFTITSDRDPGRKGNKEDSLDGK